MINNPRIQKEIKKNGNLIAGSVGFLGLGITAISAVTFSPIAALMLGGIMVPLALDVIGLKMLINKPKSLSHDISFLDKPLKKQISKWIKNYIKNSDNLTEKKYKVACLSLWMNHEGYGLNKVVSEAVFQDLSNELENNKEISKYFPLQYMFGDSQDTIKGIYGIDPSVKTFLLEDKDSPEKLEIAKKVYKEYSHVGMAASAFLNRTNFEELLILQDHKFNKEDYDEFEIYLEMFKKGEIKDPEEYINKFITTKLYSTETKTALEKIITEENDINNLKILQEYCLEVLKKSSLEHYAKNIQKKIEYIQLSGELKSSTINNKSNIKKVKI